MRWVTSPNSNNRIGLISLGCGSLAPPQLVSMPTSYATWKSGWSGKIMVTSMWSCGMSLLTSPAISRSTLVKSSWPATAREIARYRVMFGEVLSCIGQKFPEMILNTISRDLETPLSRPLCAIRLYSLRISAISSAGTCKTFAFCLAYRRSQSVDHQRKAGWKPLQGELLLARLPGDVA